MLFYRGHIVCLAYNKYLSWMNFILSFCLKYETSTGTGQPTVLMILKKVLHTVRIVLYSVIEPKFELLNTITYNYYIQSTLYNIHSFFMLYCKGILKL